MTCEGELGFHLLDSMRALCPLSTSLISWSRRNLVASHSSSWSWSHDGWNKKNARSPLWKIFWKPLHKANYHLQKHYSLSIIRTSKTPLKSHLLLEEFVNLWGITTQTSDLQQSSASFFYISSLYLFSPIRCNWSCMDWQNPQRNYSRSKRFEYLSRNYFQGVPLLQSVSMIN